MNIITNCLKEYYNDKKGTDPNETTDPNDHLKKGLTRMNLTSEEIKTEETLYTETVRFGEKNDPF